MGNKLYRKEGKCLSCKKKRKVRTCKLPKSHEEGDMDLCKKCYKKLVAEGSELRQKGYNMEREINLMHKTQGTRGDILE